MGSPSRNVQCHPPRLSEDRLNLPQPHSPSLPTHCTAPGNRECARALVTRDAQQGVPGAGQRATRFIAEIACGEPRIEIGGQLVVCAAHQRGMRENAIEGQCVHVAPVPVPREAVGPLRDGFEPSRRLLSPGRQAEKSGSAADRAVDTAP